MNGIKMNIKSTKIIFIVVISFMFIYPFSHVISNGYDTKVDFQYSLAPNPVMSGQEFRIKLDFKNSKIQELKIFIYDHDGKMFQKFDNIQIDDSQSKFEKSIIINQKGLYLIEIKAQTYDSHIEISKVKKLYVL